MVIQDKKLVEFFSKEEILNKCKEMGNLISSDYKEKNLLIISLLKGAFMFTSDLVKEISIPIHIEFMRTSSYGSGTKSSGNVKILYCPEIDFSKYDILIVDDILDSGHTMKAIVQYFEEKSPKSLKTCCLLDKPDRREVDVKLDYVGFSIPDKYIVGYGLDLSDLYRNLPAIYYLEN